MSPILVVRLYLCLCASVLVVCVRVCWAVQVGWISIQSSTEPVIQSAQFGPESNQGSHLVTNQGPGCDVTTKEIWVPWELGMGNAMNHTGALYWWNWLVGLQLRPSGHSSVNVSRLDYET